MLLSSSVSHVMPKLGKPFELSQMSNKKAQIQQESTYLIDI